MNEKNIQKSNSMNSRPAASKPSASANSVPSAAVKKKPLSSKSSSLISGDLQKRMDSAIKLVCQNNNFSPEDTARIESSVKKNMAPLSVMMEDFVRNVVENGEEGITEQTLADLITKMTPLMTNAIMSEMQDQGEE
jgi:hypothetical protein